MQTQTLTFDLRPMGKESVKVAGHGFIPAKTRCYMDTISMLARTQWEGEPWEGPILMEVAFCFATKHSERWGQYHFYKPDKDNLEKALCDSLHGIIYKDDCQIAWGNESKYWMENDEIRVRVTQLKAFTAKKGGKHNAVP